MSELSMLGEERRYGFAEWMAEYSALQAARIAREKQAAAAHQPGDGSMWGGRPEDTMEVQR
jgi:hypothetical protein